MKINIRHARFSDIEHIHAIEQQSIFSWSYDQFVSEVSREFSIFIAALEEERISGYILAWITGDQAEIHSFAVSEESSRRGIGQKLLESLAAEAAERGCGSILLEVRSRNIAAVSFYRKNGFTETGRRKNYYPDDDALLMEKKI